MLSRTRHLISFINLVSTVYAHFTAPPHQFESQRSLLPFLFVFCFIIDFSKRYKPAAYLCCCQIRGCFHSSRKLIGKWLLFGLMNGSCCRWVDSSCMRSPFKIIEKSMWNGAHRFWTEYYLKRRSLRYFFEFEIKFIHNNWNSRSRYRK